MQQPPLSTSQSLFSCRPIIRTASFSGNPPPPQPCQRFRQLHFLPKWTNIPFKLLEINVISANDLPAMAKMLRTYVVARVNSDRKMKSHVDYKGHINPVWNHKMIFRVDEKFLRSNSSAVVFEIYNVAWLRDLPIGMSRLPIQMLLNNNHASKPFSLQICRPSGHLKGTINVTVNLVDHIVPSEPKHIEIVNSSSISLDEMIAEKFEPSDKKGLAKEHDFKLVLNDNGPKPKKRKPRCSARTSSISSYSMKPLPSEVVTALNDCGDSSSVEKSNSTFGRSLTIFDDSWTVDVDDENTEKQIKLKQLYSVSPAEQEEHIKSSSKIFLDQFLLEEDDEVHKKKHHNQNYEPNRRHNSDGGGLLSCFGKGFECTFPCGKEK